MRLNAQYATMVRTSLSVLGRLMRVQAVRQKRASIESAANDDAWALHIAERCMLRVLDPKAGPPAAAPPEAPPKMVPEPTHPTSPEAAPPPDMNRQIDQPFSEYDTNSQDAAFETWLSEQPWNRGSEGSVETDLLDFVRGTMAQSPSADQESPANGSETIGTADLSRAA